MIEGIIGLFVILFLILVVPYIKGYFNPEVTSYKVFDEHSIKPLNGEMHFDRNAKKMYIYDGEAWQEVERKQGDIWFY